MVAVSFAIQSLILVTAGVASVLTVQQLPTVGLPVPLPPVPAVPRAVEIVATQRSTMARASAQPRVFTAPSRIPLSIANIADEGAPDVHPSATQAYLQQVFRPACTAETRRTAVNRRAP